MTEGHFLLREADLDYSQHRWRTASMKVMPEFITLGEVDAVCWSLLESLRRLGAFGGRFLNLLDSAPFAGAFLPDADPG